MAIRLALGSPSAKVWTLIVRDIALDAGLGLGLGAAVGVIIASWARGMFFGVSSIDMSTCAGIVLTAVTMIGVSIAGPIHRVIRLNPSLILHDE